MKIFVITRKALYIAAVCILAAIAAAVLAVRLSAPRGGAKDAALRGAASQAETAQPVSRNENGKDGLLSSAECYEMEVLAGFKRELPVYSVQRNDGKIALTIDAAWDDDKTPFILETLERYNVKATFFLCGFWVKAYPEMVKAIHDAGHEIGNHSMSHPHMSKLSADQIANEIVSLDDLIESITGERCSLFRAPFGEYDDKVILAVRAAGHEPIQWDVDTVDWKPERSSQKILDTVFSKLGDGSIILCHNNGYKIEEYLPTLLETAIAKGYEFVTVDELLLKGETVIDVNGVQKSK